MPKASKESEIAVLSAISMVYIFVYCLENTQEDILDFKVCILLIKFISREFLFSFVSSKLMADLTD